MMCRAEFASRPLPWSSRDLLVLPDDADTGLTLQKVVTPASEERRSGLPLAVSRPRKQLWYQICDFLVERELVARQGL